MKFLAPKLKDERLSPRPVVRVRGDRYVIHARFLTPLKLAVILHGLIGPLSKVWKLIACLMIWDGLFFAVDMWRDVFAWLPFSRWTAYGVMVALFGLYRAESLSGFRAMRLVFGTGLKLIITPDRVSVRRWFWFPKVFERDHTLAFGVKPLERAQDPIYQNSLSLHVIIDDSVRVPLAEIYDPVRANAVVGNANLALAFSDGAGCRDFDFDPTRLDEAPLI